MDGNPSKFSTFTWSVKTDTLIGNTSHPMDLMHFDAWMFMTTANFSSSRPLVHEASLSEAFGDSISTATSALSPLARNPQGLSWPSLWQEYPKKCRCLGAVLLVWSLFAVQCQSFQVVQTFHPKKQCWRTPFASIVFIVASALLPLMIFCGWYVWACEDWRSKFVGEI